MNTVKRILFLLCAVLLVNLCSCGGNVEEANIVDIESIVYDSEDIDSAIETIVKEFNKNWTGCTLKEIYYAGDEVISDFQDWADRNNADEVIVLLSSFSVDSSGGDGSLNPNSTYNNWNWILVRSNGGHWRHVDHGY